MLFWHYFQKDFQSDYGFSTIEEGSDRHELMTLCMTLQMLNLVRKSLIASSVYGNIHIVVLSRGHGLIKYGAS